MQHAEIICTGMLAFVVHLKDHWVSGLNIMDGSVPAHVTVSNAYFFLFPLYSLLF